jgi:hypothetical protein
MTTAKAVITTKAPAMDEAMALPPRIGDSGILLAIAPAPGQPRIAPQCRRAPGAATMTFQPGTGCGSWPWHRRRYMCTSLSRGRPARSSPPNQDGTNRLQ